MSGTILSPIEGVHVTSQLIYVTASAIVRQTQAMADKCNEREIGCQPLHVLPTCLLYLETILRFFRAIPRALDLAESLVVT